MAWLDGVVSNIGDPAEDAGVWFLTHESWRSEIASAYLGPDGAELGHEEDVRRLDGGQRLARYAVLVMRDRLPLRVQALGVGDAIGTTEYEIPESLDRVLVIFSDEYLDAGWHNAPIGARIGFALTMVYTDERWTVESIVRNTYMDAVLADLSDTNTTTN
jgi:hypothetical protein